MAALRAGADDILVGRSDRHSAPHRATVLLIDDEASVRLPLRLALERDGYRVFEAADGEEGLALIDRHGREIALVLVDHRMPKVSGAEVLRELRARADYVPVILMSGLSITDTGVDSAAPDTFLHKPFELGELARAVRHLLGHGGGAAN